MYAYILIYFYPKQLLGLRNLQVVCCVCSTSQTLTMSDIDYSSYNY